MLLITGPYKVNGVPLRRVNAAYTISTKTKVSLNGVDVSKVDDSFFKKTEKKRFKKGESNFLNKEAAPSEKENQRKKEKKAA